MTLTEAAFRELHEKTIADFAGKITGPAPSFPLGNAGAFLGANPWEPCLEWIAQYGDRVLLWMGGSPTLLLNDPDLLAELLVANGPEFHKESPRPQLLPIVTDTSCFIANGDAWKEKRDDHPFEAREFGAWLGTQVEPLRARTRSSLQAMVGASRDEALDYRKTMERASFDGFAVMAVGDPLDDAAYEHFQGVSEEAQRRLSSPIELPDINPFFHRDREAWFARFDRYLASARKAPDDSLVGRFLGSTRFSDEAFRNEVANIFPAGIFSTTSTVMHTIYLLEQDPAARERVVAAVDALGDAPDWDALRGCVPLRHAMYEAMRLHPGAPFFSRNVRTEAPLDFAGVTWPAGTTIFVTPTALHRNRAFWGDDADAFRPERWLEKEAVAQPGSAYFWPFGRGPRECLGKYWALFYATVALSVYLKHATTRFESASLREGFYFAVMVADGLSARFTAR